MKKFTDMINFLLIIIVMISVMMMGFGALAESDKLIQYSWFGLLICSFAALCWYIIGFILEQTKGDK